MATVTERYEHVVGIDTHARTHTYCIIDSRTGSMVDTRSFPTTAPGMQRAVSWIRRRTRGTAALAAVEGTSSYGAGITTALLTEGIEVAEIRALTAMAPRGWHLPWQESLRTTAPAEATLSARAKWTLSLVRHHATHGDTTQKKENPK